MAVKFFRKAALEKLSTPEKLDQLITIINPRSWILLATLTLLIAAGLGWGFYGTTKTKVNASGILLSGEVKNIVSIYNGQLLELKVKVEDEIEEGQIVAIIDQPIMRQKIEDAEAFLEEQKIQLEQLELFGSQDLRVQTQFAQEQNISTRENIKKNNGRIKYLDQQLTKEENLLKKGLITDIQVEQTRQQILDLKNNNKSLNAKLTQVGGQTQNVEQDLEQKKTLLQQRISQARRKVGQLQEQFDLGSKITSRHTGKVIEIMTDEGLMLQPGSPLYKLGPLDTAPDEMRAVLYISSKDGKRVVEDMEAFIAPATVKPQEFGYMKGIISYVSEFPATQQGMMSVLKNEGLVRQMLALGTPFEVHVELEEAPKSLSGYAWTSKGGPPIDIFPGTPCSAQLTVEEQTPISIVMPALRKFFDLY